MEGMTEKSEIDREVFNLLNNQHTSHNSRTYSSDRRLLRYDLNCCRREQKIETFKICFLWHSITLYMT